MSLMKDLILQWLNIDQGPRHIDDSYFNGYRRLANTRADIRGQHCWNCRHAVAYINWHCGRKGGCHWEACHVRDELTKADLKAGGSRWLGLPEDKS